MTIPYLRRRALLAAIPLAVMTTATIPAMAQQRHAQPPKSVRLYVFDCGVLNIVDPERFRLQRDEIVTNMMSAPCFLIAHPKGTLAWDVGVIPDGALKTPGIPIGQGYATATRPLKAQMAEAGYSPADITYLAMSHYHYDHVANANQFTGATWLARQIERDAMFAESAPTKLNYYANYSALKDSKTIILKDDEYDVFGDGSVILKSAPGHTAGHQVLFLKLAKTGPVLLSGDLYHYPEERTLNRVPTFEFNQEQTAQSRAAIEAFLKKTGAQLWIQHDYVGNSKLKKAPAYYE
jgi:glyoxylase-like metal-dependent hydrolase (beta-lactamase superfamily II)